MEIQYTEESDRGREIIYWDVGNNDILYHESLGEAVGAWLDDIPIKEFPEFITVKGYARMKIDTRGMSSLEPILEDLDEEFGDPDGGCTTETDTMKEAERVFHEVILKEYVPWMCEQIAHVKIDVMEWVKENEPHWLSEEP